MNVSLIDFCEYPGAARAAGLAYKALSRRKAAEEGVARLARVLSALDLTALGIGSTLGVGVYVLAGNVAKNYAGPAVILSFLLAAVASVLAGLCYAEFGARVPKAGSAYVYSYVCVGEFIAFVIGWNLILEYIIGAASVVKGLSEYLDALLNKTMSTYMEALMPLDTPHLARYPDLFAFFVIIAFSGKYILLLSSMVTGRCFSGLSLCRPTLLNLRHFLSRESRGNFPGSANTANWRIPASEVPVGKGSGGFAPFGLAGIIRGAAKCFYGFIGFDCVATAGEEAKRPQKTIPFAVVTSLFVIFLAYSGVSCVLTLMLPYYEQVPIPIHIINAKVTLVSTALVHMPVVLFSLLGAVFPLPRIIYAMASDGLLFKFMGRVSERFQTPLIGTMVPLVPWLPGVSILINIYLMMTIGHVTWIQFGVWLTIVHN
ncbi:hypothetical protein K1T71_008040 [Dendrolimus kikuchii]|uniref:Uncharacterized protein n=1 Tax=Dendrolimus kikuchii TaxID=765133 RepID=A0ACC1CZ39_9NEOP|nr:hypothetical protein K1T71_008040 [Dendrolimus kikuchii]